MSFTESELNNFNPDETFEFEIVEPVKNDNLSNCLLIENIPKAPKEKLTKLETVLKKVLSLKGAKPIKNFLVATSEDGSSAGCCFAEYDNVTCAKEVQEKLDGFEIDKKMKLNLKITFMTDLEEKEIKEYKPQEYQEPIQLNDWLFDKQARDQYAIRYYEQTEICWNDEIQKAITVKKENNWTLNLITWSPRGSYIATWHEQGIAIWGGENFAKQAAFAHSNAKLIDFSPCENFLLTWNEDEKKNVVVWDIKTKKVKKVFSLSIDPSEIMNFWPVYKWSHDDKYLSRMGEDSIEIWDTETFESKTISIDRLEGYSWSPNANIIAYTVPEKGTIPAKASLMEYPSKREIKTKNFFKVKEEIRINWSPKGDIVYFKVNTETKKGQKVKPKTNFEFFFVKKRNIPITTLTVEDPVAQNIWSPKGNILLLVIPGESQKSNFRFYRIDQSTNIKQVNEIKEKLFTHINFSPHGRYGIFHSPKSVSGTMEFYDFDDCEFLGQGEHFMMTDLQWDPTGRYLATSVSYHEHQSENGFIIWNFLGKMIHSLKVEKFWQFQWRPRPPTLLSEEEELAISKSLIQKKNEIVKESKELERLQKKEIDDKRKKLMTEWKELRSNMLKVYNEQKEQRKQLRGGIDSDDETDYIEVDKETVEILEQRVEEVV